MPRPLLSLLCLLLLFGCKTEEQHTRAVTDASAERLNMRQFGLSVVIPNRNGYINWSSDTATIQLHPRVRNPVADASYAISIGAVRVSEIEDRLRAERVAKQAGNEYQLWDDQLHESVAARESNGVILLRRDITTQSGKVIHIRGVVRKGGVDGPYFREAKEIIQSMEQIDFRL